MNWSVILSRQAAKDAKRIQRAGLKTQAEKLLLLLERNPFAMPPRYEKRVGNLSGFLFTPHQHSAPARLPRGQR